MIQCARALGPFLHFPCSALYERQSDSLSSANGNVGERCPPHPSPQPPCFRRLVQEQLPLCRVSSPLWEALSMAGSLVAPPFVPLSWGGLATPCLTAQLAIPFIEFPCMGT